MLWSTISDTATVIIPEEAEALLPLFHTGSIMEGVHLLTYSAPTTRRMMSFYALKYYNIPHLPMYSVLPTWLRVQLFVLAGGLYFDWVDHQALCDFLGILPAGSQSSEEWTDVGDLKEEKGEADQADQAEPATENRVAVTHPFTARPLTFLQEWLSIRRRG